MPNSRTTIIPISILSAVSIISAFLRVGAARSGVCPLCDFVGFCVPHDMAFQVREPFGFGQSRQWPLPFMACSIPATMRSIVAFSTTYALITSPSSLWGIAPVYAVAFAIAARAM